MPKAPREEVERTRLFAPSHHVPEAVSSCMESIRQAVIHRRKLSISYLDAEGKATVRTIHLLGIYFWGAAWTLAAWCESRNDFRNFRLDRISMLREMDETFDDQPGRRLEDLLARYRSAG